MKAQQRHPPPTIPLSLHVSSLSFCAVISFFPSIFKSEVTVCFFQPRLYNCIIWQISMVILSCWRSLHLGNRQTSTFQRTLGWGCGGAEFVCVLQVGQPVISSGLCPEAGEQAHLHGKICEPRRQRPLVSLEDATLQLFFFFFNVQEPPVTSEMQHVSLLTCDEGDGIKSKMHFLQAEKLSPNTSRPADSRTGCTALSPSFHGNQSPWQLGRRRICCWKRKEAARAGKARAHDSPSTRGVWPGAVWDRSQPPKYFFLIPLKFSLHSFITAGGWKSICC